MALSVEYSQTKDAVVCGQHYTLKALAQSAKDFPEWNKTIKDILVQYKEQAVLQKINPN